MGSKERLIYNRERRAGKGPGAALTLLPTAVMLQKRRKRNQHYAKLFFSFSL
jgi:hypothetical protein